MRFVSGLVVGAAVGIAAARFRRPRPVSPVPRLPASTDATAPASGSRIAVDVSDAPADPT